MLALEFFADLLIGGFDGGEPWVVPVFLQELDEVGGNDGFLFAEDVSRRCEVHEKILGAGVSVLVVGEEPHWSRGRALRAWRRSF